MSRKPFSPRAASETTLSARAKNSDIELGGKRGRESGPASLRGESKRASRDKEHAFFGSVVIAWNLVVKRTAYERRLSELNCMDERYLAMLLDGGTYRRIQLLKLST